MNKIAVQKLAETLRNIAYADDQRHKLQWSLSVVHPKTNDGDVGYSGGVWCNSGFEHKKNVNFSFSFSESKGIYNFQLWRERCEIRFDWTGKEGKITLDKLIEVAIKEYGIEELYEDKNN